MSYNYLPCARDNDNNYTCACFPSGQGYKSKAGCDAIVGQPQYCSVDPSSKVRDCMCDKSCCDWAHCVENGKAVTVQKRVDPSGTYITYPTEEEAQRNPPFQSCSSYKDCPVVEKEGYDWCCKPGVAYLKLDKTWVAQKDYSL
jgi:hypothetical protein